MKIADVVKEDITRRGVAEDSSGLEKLHNTLWTAISEQTIDEETINEIDPGMMANLYSVFPTVAKIIVSNALSKARKEAKETSLMIDVMKKHANSQPVTPQENEAMLTQFKDIVSYGLSAVAGVLTATVAGPAAGAGVALAGVYKKELLTLLQTKGPEVLIGLLKSKGKLDVVDILSANFLGKHAAPFYTAPAKPPNSGIDQQGNKIKEQGMEEGEGNFVGDFPQPNIGGATVKPMQVGDTVSYFGQTAKIQAQSPDRKHSRIEITKGTGGVVQTVLTSDLKRVHRGMSEEFRPTTGQAMGIRSQTAQKMNPDNSKFVWKRPNQIMGSHSENELRALKFKYSAKHNAWGGTQQMWGRLEGTLKELAPSGAGRGGDNYFKTLASAWYGGAYNTGSLQRGIKSKQDVERMLQQGIVCPDGVTRKFGIDYNAEYNGVVISSDDYYEHSDHGKKPGTMIDVRTGQPWGPYDYMEFSEDDLDESLNEFAPIKPPTAGAFGGNKDYGQPTSSRYIGGNKFVVGTTNNYVLTATIDKWGLEWDEDDEIWFLDSPGAAHIADASEGEIELPPPREQRNQIHDLVTDYLNARNSADLQKVAAYYGHSADGEMATSEGVRVPGQQILGTKNRAKTAYYPTNVKPKVPKLDKPLTDQELARLAQLAGIKSK